jgi:LDH2 family malate/lactate/ureidoglycolate dehydrogenase
MIVGGDEAERHRIIGCLLQLAARDVFKQRVTQLIEGVKTTPRQPGVDEIRIPSERAFRSRERARREGLEIDRLVFDALVALRRSTGTDAVG